MPPVVIRRSIVVPPSPIRDVRLRVRPRPAPVPDDATFLFLSLSLGTLIGYLAAVV
jgi:hypothetical protein